MSIYERVGRIVLLPVKLGICLIALPFVVLAYPVVAVYILVVSEGSPKQRIINALMWPLWLLAFNDFLSLGGYDNKTLSSINAWLNDKFNKR